MLLSLNMSRWACHFTTAANLTSCGGGERWTSYAKTAAGGGAQFSEQGGYLGSGDDLPGWPAAATYGEARCRRLRPPARHSPGSDTPPASPRHLVESAKIVVLSVAWGWRACAA